MEEKKNLEVVSGDGSDLDISPVYEHLNAAKPKSAKEKPTCIVIPKEKNKASKNKKDDDKNDNKPRIKSVVYFWLKSKRTRGPLGVMFERVKLTM